MSRYIQNIVLLLLVFISQLVYSQTYPVQAVPVVVSPYSSKLSDYSNPMVNRINLQLITTDLLVTNRPALLFVKIQGNGITAQSAPVLSGINPIYLNGGEILSLTSADIAGYFRFQNLQGLTTTRYSDPLPDGVYTICFQVYDLMTKKWLSQNSCATVYLMLNDPPQLNLPSNNEQIPSSDFPNIVFSWTPRHLNATNVSYEFELKEILNTSLDPAFAFEVSPLLLKEENLRTSTLLYDVSKPTLIPGKTYAWRVKAVSTNGLAENAVFKNNGYSQVFSFKYTANCSAPRFLLSEQQSRSGVKLMWQGENSHKKYHIQYRKANVENAEWFEVYTINTQTLLQGLEAGFTYEFRVGASCEMEQYGTPQSFVYSGIQTFTINKEENATSYNCGIVPKIEITNQQPLPALPVNETFMAGDFPVKVLEVTGSNGIFSGSGYIQVPYLFDTRIGVEFNNVRINSDYQMVDGVVETTYDPDWSNVEDVDEFIDDLKKIWDELDRFYDDLISGKFDDKTPEEKENIIENHNDVLDNLNQNIDKLASDGNLTAEQVTDLKNRIQSVKNCSEQGINCSDSVVSEPSSNSGPSVSFYYYYDDCTNLRKSCQEALEEIKSEIEALLAESSSKNLLFDEELFDSEENVVEFYLSEIINNCNKIFLKSGRVAEFKTNAISTVSKIGISVNGHLAYVIGKDGNKYFLSRNVETEEEDNIEKIVSAEPSDEFIAFERLESDRVKGLLGSVEAIKIDRGFVYKGVTAKYKLPNFLNSITCEEGLQVIYRISNTQLDCRTITKEDCEKIGAGEGTGEVVFSENYGKYNISISKKGDKLFSTFNLTGEGNKNLSDKDKLGIEQEVQNAINDALKELNNTEDLNSLSKKTEVSDFGFYVKQMTGKEWITTLSDLGTNVWEEAALPENYWNEDKGSKTNNVRMPALFTGVSDGVISEVTEYPQLIKLGYDVATKKEVRTGLWESVKGISVETIKDAAVDFYEEKKANYTSDKPYIVQHTVSKDAVQVASMLFAGGGITKGLKEAASNVDDGVRKAGKEILFEVDDAVLKQIDGADGLAKRKLNKAKEVGEIDSDVIESGVNELNDIAAKKGNKLSWEEVQKFFKRGNDFNKKARENRWYQYDEIHLSNGKRLDSYDEIKGEIVSRKATTLSEIKLETFRGYLKEMESKYPAGTIIRSNKYPEIDGKALSGKRILEIPSSNQSFNKMQEYKDIAKNEFNIEIRFRDE